MTADAASERLGHATSSRDRRAGRVALRSGVAAILLCVGGGTAIKLLAGNGPLAIDTAWYDLSRTTHTPTLEAISVFLNAAGAQVVVGVLIPVAVAVALAARRRPWSAFAVLLCGIVSAPLVDLIKSVLLRPRPSDQLIGVSATAYPSGHVANLAATAVVVALLAGAWWCHALAAALIAAMAYSRTDLNVHWLTDDVGGALLGAGIALTVWGALAARIGDERDRTRRPT